MKKIEKQFQDYIQSHPEESRMSALRIQNAILDSPLSYRIEGIESAVPFYTKTLHIPKMFSMEDKKNFQTICSTMNSIFAKATMAWKEDPVLQKLSGFSPELCKLIQQDPGYRSAIPMLRVDIFYDEKTKDFRFCEFNTDGTSAMFENNTVYELLQQNNAWMHFHLDHEYMELMDTWIDAFLLDVKEATGKEKPNIVITDILENAYLPELLAFARAFEKRGLVCEVCDIRKLQDDGTKLCSPETGTRFDAVYRRAVTMDVMNHLEEVQPFLQAVKDNQVVLVGGFQTQVVHSKEIVSLLFSPQMRKYLTKEECDFLDAHQPATFDLDEQAAERIEHDQNRWIIKPKDGYAARGVYAGVDVPKKLWGKLVHDFVDKGYIVQEYVPHFQSVNIDLVDYDADHFQNYANLTGLYMYNGQFAGVYSRLSNAGIVSTQYNERMVPTVFLKEESLLEEVPEEELKQE